MAAAATEAARAGSQRVGGSQGVLRLPGGRPGWPGRKVMDPVSGLGRFKGEGGRVEGVGRSQSRARKHHRARKHGSLWGLVLCAAPHHHRPDRPLIASDVYPALRSAGAGRRSSQARGRGGHGPLVVQARPLLLSSLSQPLLKPLQPRIATTRGAHDSHDAPPPATHDTTPAGRRTSFHAQSKSDLKAPTGPPPACAGLGC